MQNTVAAAAAVCFEGFTREGPSSAGDVVVFSAAASHAVTPDGARPVPTIKKR